ncbi:MAG: GNAT family N-acetyltransferase [Verrucomicrobia bacterium]|nr:GNAT family N-acetyltransferase [Verrucomicrobiota bacterium]
MTYRFATLDDIGLLTALNEQLIEDEKSSNSMTTEQLAQRLAGWLSDNYLAVLFEKSGTVVGYALYCTGERAPGEIFYFIRQFFVCREHRRRGIGREAVRLLSSEIIPRTQHLVLDVLVHNDIGRKFWKAVGFSEHCITLELPPSESS